MTISYNEVSQKWIYMNSNLPTTHIMIDLCFLYSIKLNEIILILSHIMGNVGNIYIFPQ
ncbi:unnamed protein product, partial [Vitis vinifera]|uniref:Uncharacterized protein n=1 Tax=Vitis vinifera TaxID=29760 RepID=D7TTX5_VITVI